MSSGNQSTLRGKSSEESIPPEVFEDPEARKTLQEHQEEHAKTEEVLSGVDQSLVKAETAVAEARHKIAKHRQAYLERAGATR